MGDSLISRGKTIKALAKAIDEHTDIFDAVINVPSEDPIPRYVENEDISLHYMNGMVAMNEKAYEKLRKKAPAGHWIHDLIGAYYHPACRCSVCGCHVEVESNYCPLCGADMQTARPIDIDCMGL